MIDGAFVLPLHVGHDAGIRHAEVGHPQNPESWIDDVADPAGAGVVVDRQGKMEGEIFQERVAGLPASYVLMLCREKRRDHHRIELPVPGSVRGDIQRSTHHRDHDLHVVRIVVIVHPNRRMNIGIVAGDDDLAFAVREHRVGQDQDVFRVGR
jgi:hypothetical protein